jgi:hypothetical protein
MHSDATHANRIPHACDEGETEEGIMPKGRKRTPQDSIDSILLAMCRRDNIDEDTLSHYMDRLDEEWTNGARDKVLRLLHTNDLSAHNAAMTILSELATDFDLDEIEDLVADPTVTDLAKLTIAPVLKDLSSEMADDGILDYLNDPEAAMQQMQMRLLEMMGQSEQSVEAVLEDVLAMPLEKRISFVEWLGSSYDSRAATMLIPLLESQTGKVTEAAITALEQLGSLAAPQSIPALNYLVSHTSNREIKQHARTALGRLTMQSPPGAAEAALSGASQPSLTFHNAYVSYIDGAGSQMLILSWQRPDDLIKGVNILCQDGWGIKECFSADEVQPKEWDELAQETAQKGVGSFQIPLEYARALLAEARAANKHTRRRLPVSYIVWRPLIEGEQETKPKKRASTPALKLDPLAPTADVMHLAERGNALYDLTEFVSWMFEPIERLHPFIELFWAKQPPLPPARRRRSLQKIQQSRADLEEIVTEAIDALVNEEWQALYASRLLRQAALFALNGRAKDAQLAQAVASALSSPAPVTEQSFVRAMMRYSIEQGPIRMLAEALEAGRFGPLDLSPGE